MTEYVIIRHAEANYRKPMSWNTRGWGADLAPLSVKGRKQAISVISRIRDLNVDIVICSPTTRTLETAMIIIAGQSIPFQVEFDLHEWVPDRSFMWKNLEEVQRIENDFDACKGKIPNGVTKNWESIDEIKARSLKVLEKYVKFNRVLVVSHALVIRSLTGKKKVKNTGIVNFRINS